MSQCVSVKPGWVIQVKCGQRAQRLVRGLSCEVIGKEKVAATISLIDLLT